MSYPPPPSANPTHALATAIMNYKPEWARTALEQGADIFAKGRQGDTLLAEALVFGLRASRSREKSVSGRMFSEGQIKTAALLLEHSRTQPIQRFSLFDAVVARNTEAIQHNLQPARLIESAAGEYRKALAHAVQYDDAEIVKLLLPVERFSLSDAVNAKDPAAVRTAIQREPLEDSNADEYQRCLVDAVRQDNSEIVELLLAAGMSANTRINCRGDGGAELPLLASAGLHWNQWPILTFAAARGSTAAMRSLLKAGADRNAKPDATAQPHGPFHDGAYERGLAKRRRQKPLAFLRASRLGAKRESGAAIDVKSPCSVLEFAKHFASKDVYYILHTHAGGAEEGNEFFYESVRDALKQCAVLADERFMAEAARIGTILHAKPIAWKRRKGVIHYTSSLDKALAAHYEQTAPAAPGQKIPLQLLQRLQAEVAANGYTLVYTGLAEGSLQRLLLFPLNEPLVALAACGTNAANYGHNTRDVVNWCAETRREHPLTVIGVGFDFMDLGFAQPLQNSEKLAARIAGFCPDVQVSVKDPQAVAKFAKELAESGRCFFWWD